MVVLTGAGISAESGFQTFRDSGGLWEQYAVEDVATPEGWARDPSRVTDFYNQLREQQLDAQPNAGHRGLVALEEDYEVCVITQNVDNLHERAGSSHVIHLHGDLMKVCSSAAPNDARYIETLSEERLRVAHGEKAGDGSLLRPWIVWFGESVPEIERAAAEVAKADIFVIIGSSLNVYPAAGLVHYVRPGADIYVIDPKVVNVPTQREVKVIEAVASVGVIELQKSLERARAAREGVK